MRKTGLLLVLLLTFTASAQAGFWEDFKADAAKAWEGTKSTASGVAEDAKEAYEEGKDISIEKIKEETEKQGFLPVKPETDEAGIQQK